MMRIRFIILISLCSLFINVNAQLIYTKCKGQWCLSWYSGDYSNTLVTSINLNSSNSIVLLDHSVHEFDSAGVETLSKGFSPYNFNLQDSIGGITHFDYTQNKILQVNFNLFIIAGILNTRYYNPPIDTSNSLIFLLGLDSTFNLLWNNEYKISPIINLSTLGIVKMINNPDSASFTIGLQYKDINGKDGFIFQNVDYAGSIIRANYFKDIVDIHLNDFCYGLDGFLYCLFENSGTIGILKLDTALNILNQKYFNNSEINSPKFITPVSNYLNVGAGNVSGFLRFLVDTSLNASSIYELISDTACIYPIILPENEKTIFFTSTSIAIPNTTYVFHQDNYIAIDTSQSILNKLIISKRTSIPYVNPQVYQYSINGMPVKNKSGFIRVTSFHEEDFHLNHIVDEIFFDQLDSLFRSCQNTIGNEDEPNFYLVPDSLIVTPALISENPVSVTLQNDTLIDYLLVNGFMGEDCHAVVGISVPLIYDNQIQIFPNPTYGNIRYENNSFDELLIYSIEKKLCKEFKLNNSAGIINLGDLENGVYYFTFRDFNSIITKKVVIMN